MFVSKPNQSGDGANLGKRGDNPTVLTHLSTYQQVKTPELWISSALLGPLHFHLVVDEHAEVDELQLAFFKV